jgi:ribosomal protein L7/L12
MLFAEVAFHDIAMTALAVIVVVCTVYSVAEQRRSNRARLIRLENKLDMLLRHFGTDPETATGLSAEVRRLAGEGKKIEAIKVHREQTGAGLKDAKDAVEAYMAK